MQALTSLIQEDATQSMPPFDLWLRGRDDILTWWSGPGIGCNGSRLVPTVAANGAPAFGQYKPCRGRWLRAVGAAGARAVRPAGSSSSPSSSTPQTLFPLFGLPARSRRGSTSSGPTSAISSTQLGRRAAAGAGATAVPERSRVAAARARRSSARPERDRAHVVDDRAPAAHAAIVAASDRLGRGKSSVARR